MEIADCWLDAREPVDIGDGLQGAWHWASGEGFDVIQHFSGGGKGVQGVEGFGTGRAIKYEGLVTEVCDMLLEGYSPKFRSRTTPASQDCSFGYFYSGCLTVIDVDFLTVTN